MSSAILYVAIVAIWAGVLIPRWLRRDTSASAAAPAAEAEEEAVVDSGASKTVRAGWGAERQKYVYIPRR